MKEQYCRLCMEDIYKGISFEQYLKQDQLLCANCLRQLKRINRVVYFQGIKLTILFEYNDFMENMLFQFKEGHDVALADVFFYEDRRKLKDKFRHYVFVLMPSSSEKLVERGFVPLIKMLEQIPLRQCMPFYKNNNFKQSLQSFENRVKIHQIMQRDYSIEIPNKKLLFVDDVCTSGNTLLRAYELCKDHHKKMEALVLCAHPRFVENCDGNCLKKYKLFSILKPHKR